MPEPSTQISVLSYEQSEEKLENSTDNFNENKIGNIIVLPSLEIINATNENEDIDKTLEQITEFMFAKIEESKQLLQSSSIVSFTANFLQSRVISTDIGVRLAKVYEVLQVKNLEEFNQKLEEISKINNEKFIIIQKLKESFIKWEEFLLELDKELELLVGPEKYSELGKNGKDIQLVSHLSRLAQNGSLLSYLQSSTYSLMFLEIVSSFAVQECYEHVKKMFDSLKEFNKLGCDILLLTQRPTSGGGGFLKLIGMPFRMLLNESESMKQLLIHRQSTLLMAGIRALHIYTEFLCNDEPLEITTFNNNNNNKINKIEHKNQQSGCILLNREGQILYSYLCTNLSDWPDVDILLEQVIN
ncbi:hypothetical protein Mgra_00009793 [Meloidogyne graminicola]|uniref:Uncharacterized protein n=1 Tax=Meloidogyne graminicola TaxID=189291 RepID=A0A8S9Z947_9BILA|nr:hypothetical protein Mgra_00009793 [Meloidogyne graminicola]